MVFSTSESVSLLAGPRPSAGCETEVDVFEALAGTFDRTKSAQDFGGAGGEASLVVSTGSTGAASGISGTEVTDPRLANSEVASSCSV